MSLSRPQATNPAARFMDWSGSRGELSYWDKEKQERIAVKLPFKFIALDELHTITGYSKVDESGIWSNETRRTSDDFTVRTKKGIKYVGPYKDSKGVNQVAQHGAKYAKSVYIAHKIGDEWVLGNLKLSGVALTAWIDLNAKHKTEGNIVALTGSTEGSNGATTFQIPTFEYGGAPSGEILEIATGLDRQLQDYLDTYLSAPKYDENAEPIHEEDAFDSLPMATAEQIDDFEKRKAEKLADKREDKAIQESFAAGEPINLDDIPF